MKKTLLIISTAKCVWDDVEEIQPRLEKLSIEYDTMAINHMIMYWPGNLTYGVSHHFDILQYFVAVRTYRKLKNRPLLYGPKICKEVDCAITFVQHIATSGMYAPAVGIHLGYEKIILTGMPFDDSGHFYDRLPTPEFDYRTPNVKYWADLRRWGKNKVRAVSGNLVDCFGEVTEEWLKL